MAGKALYIGEVNRSVKTRTTENQTENCKHDDLSGKVRITISWYLILNTTNFTYGEKRFSTIEILFYYK